jgi:uncharacterized protein YybS (DUF2232 family)
MEIEKPDTMAIKTTITTNHLDVYYYFSIICCLWLFHFGEPQYTYQHMLTVQLIGFIYMKIICYFTDIILNW